MPGPRRRSNGSSLQLHRLEAQGMGHDLVPQRALVLAVPRLARLDLERELARLSLDGNVEREIARRGDLAGNLGAVHAKGDAIRKREVERGRQVPLQGRLADGR